MARHQELLGRNCERMQRAILQGLGSDRPRLRGRRISLDELETFETDRRLRPVTVPVLVDVRSLFVFGAEVGTLPARGNLRPRDRARKDREELMFGRRENESRFAVTGVVRAAAPYFEPGSGMVLLTDRKQSYIGILQQELGQKIRHHRIPSSLARGRSNPLFQINHTLASLRDGVSRLVRRNWAHSKKRQRLRSHLWIWIVWRNFVRAITNRAPGTTCAMALGVMDRKLTLPDMCRWKAEYLR
ncbi:hypothetical protein [Engelhardtia mirabilis]|uniref:hypothetical protein n=1 Tax=Engelhardtia mirabilis TaxID=2528011 RepID=UPI0011A6E8F5